MERLRPDNSIEREIALAPEASETIHSLHRSYHRKNTLAASHLGAERKCNFTTSSVGLAQRGGRNAGRDFHGSIGSRRTATGTNGSLSNSRFVPFTRSN